MTPRELLLERHGGVEPKLDTVGQDVLGRLSRIQRSVPPHPGPLPRGEGEAPAILEWLRSIRWQVAGLSAAWVLVALLNVEATPERGSAHANEASNQQLLIAIRQHRQEVLRLLDTPAQEPADARAYVPGRRGEVRTSMVAV